MTTSYHKDTREFKVCRYCHSPNISYFKRIHRGRIVTGFHYGIRCFGCGKVYMVERNKFIYEKVKDLKWEHSKSSNKRTKFKTVVPTVTADHLPLGV